MSMKKLDEALSRFWSQERLSSLKGWFLKRVENEDIVGDLTGETYKKFGDRVKTGNYPYNEYKWKKLLSKIKEGVLVDYYRKKNQEKKILSLDSKIATKQEEKVRTEEFLRKNDEDLEEENLQEKDSALPLRRILLSPHRPLQEALLMLRTPLFKKLRGKVEERFPFIIKRVVVKRGINFEVKSKEEKPFSKQEEKEISEFYDLLFSLAKELRIDNKKSVFDDPIGIQALKILLISKHKKGKLFDHRLILFNLYLLSQQTKKKTYLSFNEKGKLIKKKTIKRPYLNFADKYWRFIENQKQTKSFILEHMQKYPDCPTSEKRIKDFFDIKNSKSSTIRINRLRFNEKIEKYNLILKNIMEKKL